MIFCTLNQRRKSALLGASAIAGLIAVLPASAYAQNESPDKPVANVGLEDIVVTARRSAERLQDIPLAVTALTQSALANNSVERTEDLQILTPGLTVAPSTRSDTAPNYMIRGQRGALSPVSLTDPAVSVYFAEMNQSRSQGTNTALYDLASVQVLKGPQGTLFGRNSTGGAVLIEPNAPSHDFEAYVQASVGDYNLIDGEGMINLPLAEGVMVRASGKVTRRRGYLYNAAHDEWMNDQDSQNYRLQMTFQPSEAIESRFIVTRYLADQNGTGFKFAAFNPARISATSTRGIRTTQLYNGIIATEEALGRYAYSNPDPIGVKEDLWTVQNNTSIELGDVGGILGDIKFKNVVGWRKLDNSYNDARYPGMTFVTGGLHNELFTEEAQIQTHGKYLDTVFGAYYFKETGDDQQISYIFADLAPVSSSFPSVTAGNYDFSSRSWAVFAHANYDMSQLIPGLSFAGGLRYTNDKKTANYHNLIWSGLNPTSYTCAVTGATLTQLDYNQCNEKESTPTSGVITYDASLSYKLSNKILAYVAHRRGYRSGSLNASPIFGSIVLQTDYGPEYVKDLELGLKSDFHVGDAPARLNIAVYQQWYKEIQRQLQRFDTATNTSANSIVNASSAIVKGAEVEFTIKPSDSLTLSANYAYTDAKYTKFDDFYVGSGGAILAVDISDSPFSYVPKHQFSAVVNYQLPVPEKVGEFFLNANVSGISSRTSNDIGTSNCGPDGGYIQCQGINQPDNTKLKPYALVNMRLDWKNVMGQPFDVGVFVNNVFDKYYLTHVANNWTSSIAAIGIGIGAPRMFGVELRARIGALAN